ncbi:MAG: DUF2807 domain-containing protein [Bacteroides sp.]|nr:DUF2807 domain-containing protein [Roseburia sp.]MCM1347561.1 DUF2807 domain-containing protein [Bacteroides sp.]MCM1420999.1 DUF2807 domain-containing protein [Bacteroides sp.]
MKRNVFFLMTAVLCVFVVSCKKGNDNNVPETDGASESKKVVTHLKVAGDFYQITNIGSVDIVYTEGDYKIDVECDSSLLPYVSTVFDSGTLTVYMRREEKGDVNWLSDKSDVTLYVSCPKIKYIAVCGSGSFKSVGTIHSTDMQIGSLGLGDIELDSVECETFDYELRTESNAAFKHITCNSAKFSSYGGGMIQAEVDAADRAYAMIGSVGNMDCKFRSDNVEILSFSEGNGNFDVQCNQLSASIQGTGKICLNGYAKQKFLKSGTSAVVENNLK